MHAPDTTPTTTHAPSVEPLPHDSTACLRLCRTLVRPRLTDIKRPSPDSDRAYALSLNVGTLPQDGFTHVNISACTHLRAQQRRRVTDCSQV